MIRLARTYENRKAPHWAARILRLLSPEFQQIIKFRQWSHPLVQRVRDTCSGVLEEFMAVVYVLGSYGGAYLGKAKLFRRRLWGTSGRALEHMRCLLRPLEGEGYRKRYGVLRVGLGALMMLPCLWLPSEEMALHYESFGIRLEMPNANNADLQALQGKIKKATKTTLKRPTQASIFVAPSSGLDSPHVGVVVLHSKFGGTFG